MHLGTLHNKMNQLVNSPRVHPEVSAEGSWQHLWYNIFQEMIHFYNIVSNSKKYISYKYYQILSTCDHVNVELILEISFKFSYE